MISNSTAVYKLKGSKSYRDVPDADLENSDESGDQELNDKFAGEKHHGSSSSKNRTRSTEFRSSKSKNHFKGRRGEASSRRNDYSDGYYSSRKFENSRNEGGAFRGKCYEPEKKQEVKLNLPEDTRISKLLRRLSTETIPDSSIRVANKLMEVLLYPDNSSYVRKAFHILGESMFDILHVSPGSIAKQHSAKALGRMGYIMGQEADFERYHNWLFSKINNSHDDMQILLLSSFKETFDLELKKPVLADYIENLINNLVAAIEVTDNPEVFKKILETLVLVVEIYPNEFYTQFRDTVDLMFGWHVDHTQSLTTIEFISKNMQKLGQHFRYNVEFSVGLVENFLEDINNFGVDDLDHLTVLILAMNTVLKCLDVSQNKLVAQDFVIKCLNTIIDSVTKTLDSYLPENLIIASNECIGLLLPCLEIKPQGISNAIYSLIDLELGCINDLPDAAVVSIFILITKVIKELSQNLPMELIEKLIGPQSDVVKLRSSPYTSIQNAVICVYQALLNLKNVSLLQEAYRYVLGDLERFFLKIIPTYQPVIENNPFDLDGVEGDAELTVMFLLRCLSQLANASSIIVMWALKPSILELVGVHLQPHNPILAKKQPHIQYSLLYLMFSHCKCYNHFISNSSLVSYKEINRFTEGLNADDVPSTSPNSGHFKIILEILHKCLSIETSVDVTLLLLTWINDILINSDRYLEAYYLRPCFSSITEVLVKTGYSFNELIVDRVCDNLEKLLSNKQLSWSNHFLISVSDLCKLHMSSTTDLKNKYCKLSSNIPWDICVVEFNKVPRNSYNHKSSNSKDYNDYMVHMAQNLHLTGSVDGEMGVHQFKQFMDLLLNKTPVKRDVLQDIFTTSWSHDCDSRMDMELFYDLTMRNRQVLYNWCTLEAALFCVNFKLRTPLGKPNETFLKIENALADLGNDLLMINNRDREKDCTRVRMLLNFIEHLEKCIYNASEGCAVAMAPPSKAVKSFFMANLNTCHEWLSRIRLVIIHIALHCGLSPMALKHGQCLLRDLHKQGQDFEKVAMFVTLALLSLKEPEALFGLYNWCKQAGKRYLWIKFAADQASKRYEVAVEGYKKILQEDAQDKKLDQDVANFVQDQIVVCYKELNDWIELFVWQDSQATGQNGKKYWFNTTDWECNRKLYQLEADELSLHELSTWNLKEEQNTWSLYENITNTETNLYNCVVNLAAGNAAVAGNIQQSLELVQQNIQDLLPLAPSEFLQNYSLLQYVAMGLKNVADKYPAHTVFLVSEEFEREIDKIDTSVLRKILWWSEYFAKIQNQGFNVFSSNLRLDIIKRARKEKNIHLATRQIIRFFKDKGITFSCNQLHLVPVEEFSDKFSDLTVTTVDAALAMLEVIKVIHHNDQAHSTALNLSASVSTTISKHAELYGSKEHRNISSKLLLKMATWMNTSDVNITDLESPLGKLLMVLPDVEVSSLIPPQESAIGKLLQFGAHQCPNVAKSWCVFGTWCYKWGRKIVDHSSNIKNNLSEEHCAEIEGILPADTSQEELTKIFVILSQTRSVIMEEDIDSNDINTSDMIQAQLRTVGVLNNASDEVLANLVQIWRKTQKNIYSYYHMSAEAYFKFLHLVMNGENTTRSSDCNTITVTLRLLRLMVKYALELQVILEEGLKTTPTQPWKVIIPQLFSRLNHPESYVRLRVSELLCRVAEDAPQLITFPAVVGALEGGVKFDFSEIKLPKDCLSQNNDNEDEDDSDTEDETTGNTLQTCFKSMVDTLSKQDPETISQVQTLVKELRRITLLWDELWLGTLAQHQSEITKRQQQVEYEIEKVNENSNLSKEEKTGLIAEKHRIIVKPIIFVLEQLSDVTSLPPETPHEKSFQDKYMNDIQEVINKLKNPENPEKPQESLMPLKLLQKKFQQKFHKRTSYSLRMQDISPILHQFKNTLIAMPGLVTGQGVTICHVDNRVSILPTKTKPKKLMFLGSNGQTYTYLFKGLEDLHLDERIMQFLSIANTMMAQNADPAGNNLYRARHYSVIPLGPRSGLISWVESTMPIFGLYKRWQQRELAKPNSKLSTIPRPSELFYNKLVEHGVKNIENRKEWPLSVLKDVLQELMNETPSDLIAKELWCNAVSANAWWQVVKRYSYSIAVMSIIGYIIGLGDRHLDNMLIDLLTGDVVHIDYNVCFEKGKTLRVPEKVPFRLTPNIREALGVTGVEGIFRLACENVLKTMRKGRETLLTLLEAFVYDPLIDWTTGGEVLAGTTFGVTSSEPQKRQSKKELEKEVTLAMFDVRCTEMKVEWLENKDEILNEIPALVERLNLVVKVTEELDEVEDELQDFHQQLALVKEAEAVGPVHSLYKLPELFNDYVRSQEAMNVAKKSLADIIADSESQSSSMRHLTAAYETQKLTQWMQQLKYNVSGKNTHIFDLVKEFLHNAGKDEVVSQCETSEVDVSHVAQQINLHTTKCIQILQDYTSLLVQCPKKYHDRHRFELYSKWANYLLSTKTTATCDLVMKEFNGFLKRGYNSAHAVNVACTLDAYYQESLMHVNKLFEELTLLRQNTSVEAAYAQAKLKVDQFSAQKPLLFVVAGELMYLNRVFLTSETTAQKSGNWLIKLTSRDGDWFLDDLLLHSLRAVEWINLIPQEGKLAKLIAGIKSGSALYKSLYDLNFNFHTIILPETMKKVQQDEDSVQQMMGDLERVVGDDDLQEMISEMEKMLTCVMMHVDIHNTYDAVQDKISQIRTSYLSLIPNQSSTLSQGNMLLMGFNGLFEKSSQELQNLATITDLDLPKSWKKLDYVKEARIIASHIFNPRIRSILEDIFFLKKLVCMTEFFTLARQMCLGLRLSPSGMIMPDENLTKPVKQFISEFISRQLLGIVPEMMSYCTCLLLESLGLDVGREIEQRDIGAENKVSIEELYNVAYNYLQKEKVFDANLVQQVSGLVASLKLNWEKLQEPKKLEQKLTVLQSSTFRLQAQMAVFNLVFDDVLSQNNFPCVRDKFIVDFQRELAQMANNQQKMKELRDIQLQLIDKARQRLNWAKGANPNVIEIVQAFDRCVGESNAQLDLLTEISDNILQFSGVLQYELLRRDNADSAKEYDRAFKSSCDKWRCVCEYFEIKVPLLPAEERILNMLDVDILESPNWLSKVSKNLTDVISLYNRRLQDKKEDLFTETDCLVSLVSNFKSIFNIHTKLMQEIKGLLKTMSKIDEYSQSTHYFLHDYKKYTDNFSLLFANFKESPSKVLMNDMQHYLEYIVQNTEDIYDGLMGLKDGRRRPKLRRQSCVVSDRKPENKVQQRNAYALNVWRRVKMKLEGRDPDGGRKCTAQEQVDYVIREATSLDNLALLYEGWTPWV